MPSKIEIVRNPHARDARESVAVLAEGAWREYHQMTKMDLPIGVDLTETVALVVPAVAKMAHHFGHEHHILTTTVTGGARCFKLGCHDSKSISFSGTPGVDYHTLVPKWWDMMFETSGDEVCFQSFPKDGVYLAVTDGIYTGNAAHHGKIHCVSCKGKHRWVFTIPFSGTTPPHSVDTFEEAWAVAVASLKAATEAEERRWSAAAARKKIECDAWYEEQATKKVAREAADAEVRKEEESGAKGYTKAWAEAQIRTYGYRECAKKHHPDIGGQHEAMVALNIAAGK